MSAIFVLEDYQVRSLTKDKLTSSVLVICSTYVLSVIGLLQGHGPFLTTELTTLRVKNGWSK